AVERRPGVGRERRERVCRRRDATERVPWLRAVNRHHASAAGSARSFTDASVNEHFRSPLHELADRAGILPEYKDQTGHETRRTSDDTRRALLTAMRF